MNALPDLRQVEPELLQDDIEWALQDSMDVDWTCATGARAVMRLLHQEARNQTKEGRSAQKATG